MKCPSTCRLPCRGKCLRAARIEKVARIICVDRRQDPDALEPGDLPQTDGTCANGDPGHYHWRDYAPLAKKIIKALDV